MRYVIFCAKNVLRLFRRSISSTVVQNPLLTPFLNVFSDVFALSVKPQGVTEHFLVPIVLVLEFSFEFVLYSCVCLNMSDEDCW